MKKFIAIVMCMFALTSVANAQSSIARNGKVFTQTSSRTTKKDTLVTDYKFEDSYGNTYPIIINKNSGRCYIYKKSKTGNLYKFYMKEEISRQICKELGIAYVEKKKTNNK